MTIRDLNILVRAVHAEYFAKGGQLNCPWAPDKGEASACKRLTEAGFLANPHRGAYVVSARGYATAELFVSMLGKLP